MNSRVSLRTTSRHQPPRRRALPRWLTLALLACAPMPAVAQAPAPAPPAFAVPNSEVHTRSAGQGEAYQIAVGLPGSYATATTRRYPVLVVLDGDILFGTAAEMAAMLAFEGAQELIVVGVGFGARRSGALRSRDYTPTLAPEPSARDTTPADGPLRGGGAPAFLAFLRDSVLPFLDARYRTDTAQRGIFGHSFGGLFALYALFRAPGVFSRYIVGSPALWWDQRVTLQYEAEFAASHRDLSARIFLGGGEREQPAGNVVAARFGMRENWMELAQRLRGRGYASLQLQTHLFPGEGHVSVAPFVLSHGIRAVFSSAPPRP